MNTNSIAQILGIFFLVAGISMVANRKATGAAIEASVQNKGTLWLWGIFALLIGAIVVVFNNVWTSGLPLLVTLIGWIALLKGVLILILPDAAGSLYKKFATNSMLVLAGIVAVILGLVLLY